MSGDNANRRGRPLGILPATLQRARLFRELIEIGVPVWEIAVGNKMSESHVYRLIKLSREFGQAPPGHADAPRAEPADRPAPAWSEEISPGTMLHRALLAMHADGRLRAVGRSTRMFWLEAVMAIHRESGSTALWFPAVGYEDCAEFVRALHGTEDKMALLISCGLLLELPNDGIALPYGLGLGRPEKIRAPSGRAIPPASIKGDDR